MCDVCADSTITRTLTVISREAEDAAAPDVGVWVCERERKWGGGGMAVLWGQTAGSYCYYITH